MRPTLLPTTLRSCAGLALLTLTSLTSVGCGMGTDPQANTAGLVTSGLPRCDASLLHPRITVGATTHLPGKLIVYVDGIMACVDDAARVDQLVGQVEGRSPAAPDDTRVPRR